MKFLPIIPIIAVLILGPLPAQEPGTFEWNLLRVERKTAELDDRMQRFIRVYWGCPLEGPVEDISVCRPSKGKMDWTMWRELRKDAGKVVKELKKLFDLEE